jgi:hypothetical protein
MPTLVQAGSRIEFCPDGTWNWYGWDGCLSLSTVQSRADFCESGFIIFSDLQRLGPLLADKPYAAVGYEATPGVTDVAEVSVDENSLCDRMVIEGEKTATSDTTGKFTIAVKLPSFQAGTPPAKDPSATHSGTWRILTPSENRTSC